MVGEVVVASVENAAGNGEAEEVPSHQDTHAEEEVRASASSMPAVHSRGAASAGDDHSTDRVHAVVQAFHG